MRKMLSIILLFLLCPYVSAHGCERRTISIPVRGSSIIFIGTDERMPKDGCFRFSIDDKSSHNPVNLIEAEDQIIATMPHWIYLEIKESKGDHECMVQVNKLDYFGALIDFYVEKWVNSGMDISKLGHLRDGAGESFQNQLQELVCKRVKQALDT